MYIYIPPSSMEEFFSRKSYQKSFSRARRNMQRLLIISYHGEQNAFSNNLQIFSLTMLGHSLED